MGDLSLRLMDYVLLQERIILKDTLNSVEHFKHMGIILKRKISTKKKGVCKRFQNFNLNLKFFTYSHSDIEWSRMLSARSLRKLNKWNSMSQGF